MAAFTRIDALAYHDSRSTLWGWPRQNAITWSDPSGRWGMDGGGGVDRYSHGVLNMSNSERADLAAAQGGALASGLAAGAALGWLSESAIGAAFANTALGRWLLGGAGATATQQANSCSDKAQSISLGMQTFSSNGGDSGAIAENVVKTGDNLRFENFTVAAMNGGNRMDLAGGARQLLQYAQEQGATSLTFQGTFTNPDLAARFNAQAGDSFNQTVPATMQGILSALSKNP
jgi:hypothetical protein